MKMHRKTRLLWHHHDVWEHIAQDTIYQYNRPLVQKIRILILPMLQRVNWGPEKLSYPCKGVRNVIHSCEHLGCLGCLLSEGGPLRNNSRRTEEQMKHLWTSFINKPTYFYYNLGQIKIDQELSWRSTSVLMGIRHSVAPGAVRHQELPHLARWDSPASQTRNLLLGLCSLNTNAATLWWIKIMLENEFTCFHHWGTVFSCLLASAKPNTHDKTKY